MNKLLYKRLGAFLFWGGYQAINSGSYLTQIKGYHAQGDLYTLHPDGLLEWAKWLAWDGPTKAIKTKEFVAGSFIHDILCDAINRGLLPREVQPLADAEMLEINKTQKMNWLRRRLTYRAVRIYQDSKTKPYKEKIYEVSL